MTEEELTDAAAVAVAQIGRRLGAQVVPEDADPAQLLAACAIPLSARKPASTASGDRTQAG